MEISEQEKSLDLTIFYKYSFEGRVWKQDDQSREHVIKSGDERSSYRIGCLCRVGTGLGNTVGQRRLPRGEGGHHDWRELTKGIIQGFVWHHYN